MKIKDILNAKGRYLYKVKDDAELCEILKDFREKKIGSSMVYDTDENIIGIITEKDALKCFRDVNKFSDIKIKDIMTKFDDIIIASEDDSVQYAMGIMTENRIKHLPIFKGTDLVGMISIGDIVKAQLEESKHIAKTYLDHIKGKTPQPENVEF